VQVAESQLSWSETMKVFRKSVEPALNALKKQKVLLSWTMVQTGDHTGLLITEFYNKAKMNKFLKTIAAIRQEVIADTGMQTWIYHGPVKASG
jgi:hypothetical protein